MKTITASSIKALKPCAGRYDNFIKHYPDFTGSLTDFLNLDNISYQDKVWVFTKLATHVEIVRWSILCAHSVLNYFTDVYPDDNRPQLALEAAEEWCNNPCEGTRLKADSAAWSAADLAARSAAWSVAWSAESAAWSAESAHQEELNLMFMIEAVTI